jgi:transcriptional regulator with XRE-family HTH domain
MRQKPSKLVRTVRQRIRELRRERGLTQEELCERAGISVDAISRIESGNRTPSLVTIERIADALGVSPAALFEGAPPAPARPQPEPLRRVVSLLQVHPEPVLLLAENVITALVRAYRDGSTSARERRRPAKRTR